MAVLWEFIDPNGRMVDVYTDRAAMFMVTPRLMKLGRGLRELGIGWLPAHAPQAKCRVVKDPRLAKITTLETSNAFLAQEYWPYWNERFARPVNDPPINIGHRPRTWNWPRFCVRSKSALSPTTTSFP